MGINDLPVELADQIIRPFCVYCTPDKTDLPSIKYNERKRISFLALLCLLSRRLNVTATPHLYHCLRVRGRKWPLLARTLLARKDLAQFAQTLHLHNHWNADKSDSSPALEKYFTAKFQAWQDSLSDDDRETFGWQFHDTPDLGNMFAAPFHNLPLDILASLCPNLKTVSATLTFSPTFRFNPALSLPRLQTASFDYHDTRNNGISLLDLQPLSLAAPNLTSLTLTRLDGSSESHGDGTITPPLAQLRHLDCRYSAVSVETLVGILASCPRLVTFKYAWGGYGVGNGVFTLPEAADAVEAHAPATLGLFRLSMGDDDVIWPEDWEEGDVPEVRRRLAERGICFQFSWDNMDGVEWRGGVDG